MADDGSLINEVLAETSFLYGGNAAFVEDLYARWTADPKSVDTSWQAFFASLNDRADEVKAAAGKRPWTSAKMSEGAMPRMMRMILPFRFHVASVEGTWKLNQNKTPEIRARAAEALSQGDARAQEIAALMRRDLG